jgi:hypothetical protein
VSTASISGSNLTGRSRQVHSLERSVKPSLAPCSADLQFGNFYAFKYCLRGTAEKYEKKNLNYALMAHIVREGGFWIVFVSRLSAIPGYVLSRVVDYC